MKANAKCPKCGKSLTTNCGGCIESGTDYHVCKGKKKADLVENVKWKKVPETEKELNEMDFE